MSKELPTIKKKRFDGEEVEILGELYEAGEPEVGEKYDWEGRLGDREWKLKYLKNALRYWYGESYGSEKRKNPA